MNELNQVLLHPHSRVGPDLEAWMSSGGGEALRIALEDPAAVIDQLEAADLRGLGGSGFPVHRKWRVLAQNRDARNKHLICNGNEDEPGTFKDRVLLDETPHQVIEGALIAAVATGIGEIHLYINPHMDQAIGRCEQAVRQWQRHPIWQELEARLGRSIKMEVALSSGHYIGGEETAAIEWLEGGFPFPRGKPPYPFEVGIHGAPTLINNVETLANVPHILRHGVEWYHQQGQGKANGTKLFSLSGDILRPGVYELPMGVSLARLIHEYGGGPLSGKAVKAVFTGGPSNSILAGNQLDLPLDFDTVRAQGSSLGTGAMIVVSKGTGMVKRLTEYAEFFADASCGQCPPCKTGTRYISTLLERIDCGQGSHRDLDHLQHLCRILPGSGRCHLLDGVIKVVNSSFDHFMDEFEEALH